jgi:putative molybdopterin biosynthesis protein
VQPELAPVDVLLTPDEVARRLAVSRSLIYQLVKKGKLRAVHIGRLPRIRPADLDAFVASAEQR